MIICNKIKAKRIGDLQRVKNINPHWAANSFYNFVRLQLEDGKEIPMLFTDNEIKRAIDRAQKNKEDLPKVSLFRDIFD